MNKSILGTAIIGAVKTVIPTQNVEIARASKAQQMENLTLSEKVNYKLHDRTTWGAISLIAYYGYTQDWTNLITQIVTLIQGF